MLRRVAFLSLVLPACGGTTAALGPGTGDASSQDAPSGQDAPFVGVDATPDASPAQALDCVPDASASFPTPSDPAIRDSVTGTNGTFVDSCDPQGNLVDYSCETATSCGAGPNPDCTEAMTGRVISQSIDCSGHCVDGRCASRCPTEGDRYHFTAVGPPGNATIVNDTDGRTYQCAVLFDRPDDSYDCTNDPAPGVAGSVTSLGLHGSWCTGKDFGNIGVSIDGLSPPGEACAYGCGIL